MLEEFNFVSEHPALYHLSLEVDTDRLKSEALATTNYSDYYDPITKRNLEGWGISHIESGYGKAIADIFREELQLEIRPRFYILEAGTTLPMHVDRGTQCSFNIIADGTSPITFEEGEFYYKQALLNTQVMHGVFNTIDDRVLYKLSVFDATFEETKRRYLDKEDIIQLKINVIQTSN